MCMETEKGGVVWVMAVIRYLISRSTGKSEVVGNPKISLRAEMVRQGKGPGVVRRVAGKEKGVSVQVKERREVGGKGKGSGVLAICRSGEEWRFGAMQAKERRKVR